MFNTNVFVYKKVTNKYSYLKFFTYKTPHRHVAPTPNIFAISESTTIDFLSEWWYATKSSAAINRIYKPTQIHETVPLSQ